MTESRDMGIVTKLFFSCLVFATIVLATPIDNDIFKEEEKPDYWKSLSMAALDKRLQMQLNKNKAKNLILFLGDGTGITTLTAGRIMKGQKNGKPGEETVLAIDKLPHTGLIKTYCLDRQIVDSAASATAYLAGVKSKYGTIGVDGRVERNKCSTQDGKEVKTILDWAKEAGKSVGIVTTARVTHASPAACYAHAAARFWEDDTTRQSSCPDDEDCTECKDIAAQLIEDNPNINVILGGGRRHFLPSSEGGRRSDGKSLIQKWKDDKQDGNKNYAYVTNTGELNAVSEDTEFLLGLFSDSHMSFNLDRDTFDAGQPHIKDMTKKAIEILSKNPKGFFLFVEGARIDHAHHAGVGKHALEDTVAFDEAVAQGMQMTNEQDTTTVVTADHSFTLSIAGYAKRGNPILGVSDPISQMDTPTDGFLYTTLLYSTGDKVRGFVDNEIALADGYKQDVAIPMIRGAHGGDDVTVHASGPRSYLFAGVQEQTYIPYALAYAAGIGPYADEDDR